MIANVSLIAAKQICGLLFNLERLHNFWDIVLQENQTMVFQFLSQEETEWFGPFRSANSRAMVQPKPAWFVQF